MKDGVDRARDTMVMAEGMGEIWDAVVEFWLGNWDYVLCLLALVVLLWLFYSLNCCGETGQEEFQKALTQQVISALVSGQGWGLSSPSFRSQGVIEAAVYRKKGGQHHNRDHRKSPHRTFANTVLRAFLEPK